MDGLVRGNNSVKVQIICEGNLYQKYPVFTLKFSENRLRSRIFGISTPHDVRDGVRKVGWSHHTIILYVAVEFIICS